MPERIHVKPHSLATLNLSTGRILAVFLAIFLLIIRFTQPTPIFSDSFSSLLSLSIILYCLGVFVASFFNENVRKYIYWFVLIAFVLYAFGFYYVIYQSNFNPVMTSGLFVFSILTAFFMLSVEHLAVYQIFLIAFLFLTYFISTPPEYASGFLIRFSGLHAIVFVLIGSRVRYIERLAAENQEKERMIQKLNCGVFQIDREGHFTLTNQMFCQMTQYSEKEIAEHLTFPQLVLEEDRSHVTSMIENSLQGDSDKFEARLVKKEGKPFWVFGTVTPRYNNDHAIVGTTFILADITQKKEIADQFSEQLQDHELTIQGLNQKNEELQKFLHWAGLELRIVHESIHQPLTSLENHFGTQKPQDEDLAELKEKVKNLNDIIDRFQFYSLASYVKPHYEKIHTEQIVEEIKASLKEDIILNHANITYTDLPIIEADRTQFHRLMSNLIENGLKYRGSDPPKISISCTENLEKNEFVFAIEDNGVGISKDDYDKIFRLFEQDREEDKGTLGLGLTISKKIVLNHHGRLWFTSNYGKGSTFFFAIPREKPIESPVHAFPMANGQQPTA
ncbi:MAG: PAS domain S-box protein [Bacteroidetes bacterium]|nr:PAS domain S-box protein [Bacteroidota bacterium]MCB0842659.1 PAS domain S-box protein [Bacteroidota bacterium]